MHRFLTSIFLLILICLNGCDKFNLPRDNPLDASNNTNNGELLEFSNFDIVYDNNSDQIINKGETVYLKIYIANNGANKVNKVKATFSSSNVYLSNLTPVTSIDYGDIYPGYTEFGNSGYTPNYSNYTIKFTVLNTTPNNTKIPIDINITDESGDSWKSLFEVEVLETGAQLSFSSFDVVYDNNGDLNINKGETVYLKVFVVNNGSSTVNKVKATFSSNNAYISNLHPATPIDYGDIYAGYNEFGNSGYAPNYSSYTIKFSVSNTTPNNTKIPIDINITDEFDNSWISSFEAEVQATGAQLSFSSFDIVYDDNGNHIVNKGETVYLKVFVINNGSSTVNNLRATFSSTNPYLSNLTPTAPVDYGDIYPGYTEYGDSGYAPNYSTYTIKFTASANTPSNSQIQIKVEMIDENLNAWSDSFLVTVE